MRGPVRDTLTGVGEGGGLDLSCKQGAADGLPVGGFTVWGQAAQPGAWAAQRADHRPARTFLDRRASSSRCGVGRLTDAGKACKGRGRSPLSSRLATGRRIARLVPLRSHLWAGVIAALRGMPRPLFWRGV